jgi:hypothetical protein
LRYGLLAGFAFKSNAKDTLARRLSERCFFTSDDHVAGNRYCHASGARRAIDRRLREVSGASIELAAAE